jgi:hypothetical protein
MRASQPQETGMTIRASRLSLWLFGLVILVKAAQSLVSIFNPYAVAVAADGVPVDTYGAAGARAVVALFSVLGLSNFIFSLIGVVALTRYRGMVSFMFALILLQQIGGRVIAQVLPVARTGTPPGSCVSLALITITIVGLTLSLWSRHSRRAEEL